MNNQDILRIAMEQSAIDFNCSTEDFTTEGCKVVSSELKAGRKSCYKKPLLCKMAYYGEGLVVSADQGIQDYMEAFIHRHPGYRCFDTPQLIVMNREFEKYGNCVCHIAEFFLPDRNKQVSLNPAITIKMLYENEIPSLYHDKRFSMALSYEGDEDKKDVIAAVGYLDGQIVGIAGASNDCDTMWQVGIDVLPGYRRQGIAATLTRRLTDEILSLGKVPYYVTAWSNLASKNNAIRCGYRSTWVEMAAKEITDAMEMIGENNDKR